MGMAAYSLRNFEVFVALMEPVENGHLAKAVMTGRKIMSIEFLKQQMRASKEKKIKRNCLSLPQGF